MDCSKNRFIVIMIVVFSTAEVCVSHLCFVCHSSHNPPDRELMDLKSMFKDREVFRPCSYYHKANREEYIMQCPKGSQGCMSRFKDENIFRSCSPPNLSLNDCEDFQGETFCYCTGELCNTPDRKLAMPSASYLPDQTKNSDMEEEQEIGSGDYYATDDDDYEDGVTMPPNTIDIQKTFTNYNQIAWENNKQIEAVENNKIQQATPEKDADFIIDDPADDDSTAPVAGADTLNWNLSVFFICLACVKIGI